MEKRDQEKHQEPWQEERKTLLVYSADEPKNGFPLARAPRRLFFFPGRTSGGSHSAVEPELALSGEKKDSGGQKKSSVCQRVSGSALCKVTALAYLIGCVLVSALYVALYGGQSQKLFAASDAWIPGKVRRRIEMEGGGGGRGEVGYVSGRVHAKCTSLKLM